MLKVGDEVEAVIVEFNEADKKISLSIKALTQANEELEKENARNSESDEE